MALCWFREKLKEITPYAIDPGDGGYAGKLIDWVKQFCGWMLEIVKRNDDIKGFQVLPHRWVAERTFG